MQHPSPRVPLSPLPKPALGFAQTREYKLRLPSKKTRIRMNAVCGFVAFREESEGVMKKNTFTSRFTVPPLYNEIVVHYIHRCCPIFPSLIPTPPVSK